VSLRDDALAMTALRIAFVAGAFPKLSETFVLQQIVGLLALGHDVHIYAFENPGEAVAHPEVAAHRLLERTLYLDEPSARARAGWRGSLVRTALAPFFSGAALSRRVAHGPQGRFDVIYCHFAHVAELARQLRSVGFFEGPLAGVVHGYDVTTVVEERGERFYEPLFRDAARLYPVSNVFRAKLISLGADPDKVEVRRMGVDTGALAYAPKPLAAGETPRLVSVGRLVEKKGIEHGLRAMAAAQRSLARPLHYDVVGDGPLRAALEVAAEREGVAGRVVFHGSKTRAETQELVAGAHVLLAPSVTASNGDMEGIPVVLMEAMALGVPVLSTKHSGIPELVEDGASGILVPEGDPAALGAALAELLQHSERWDALTRTARRRVEDEFDNAVLVRRMARAFSDLSRA
jgi:colanic acid/amylovoran biosynthesis glycosyltransferase